MEGAGSSARTQRCCSLRCLDSASYSAVPFLEAPPPPIPELVQPSDGGAQPPDSVADSASELALLPLRCRCCAVVIRGSESLQDRVRGFCRGQRAELFCSRGRVLLFRPVGRAGSVGCFHLLLVDGRPSWRLRFRRVAPGRRMSEADVDPRNDCCGRSVAAPCRHAGWFRATGLGRQRRRGGVVALCRGRGDAGEDATPANKR